MKILLIIKKILTAIFLKIHDLGLGLSRITVYNKNHLPLRDLIFRKGKLYKHILYYEDGSIKQVRRVNNTGYIYVSYYENGLFKRIEFLDKVIDAKPFWFSFDPDGGLNGYRASLRIPPDDIKKLAASASNRL